LGGCFWLFWGGGGGAAAAVVVVVDILRNYLRDAEQYCVTKLTS